MPERRSITPSTPAKSIRCSEFRRGRGYANWRPHGSGDWLLIATQSGAGDVRISHEKVQVVSKDVILFAPGVAQDYSSDGQVGHWHLRWAHFQPRAHWSPWLMWPEVAPGVGFLKIRDSSAEMIDAALSRMLAASQLGDEHWEHFAMNALEEVLLWIFRMSSNSRLSKIDPRIQRAMNYIVSHPSEPFELGALASHCGLSLSRFSHLFRSELGKTPQQFSEEIRMESARQLLAQTNLSVSEVAAEAGYSDPFYFSRRFRRFFGSSPRSKRV